MQNDHDPRVLAMCRHDYPQFYFFQEEDRHHIYRVNAALLAAADAADPRRVTFTTPTEEQLETLRKMIAEGHPFVSTEETQTYVDECRANAAYIVTACNAYPALVEALEWALKRIDRQARHKASEGDAELYRFMTAQGVLDRAKAGVK